MEDWLTTQQRAAPDRLALTYQEESWTYAQLEEEVNQWCGRLSSLGLQPGEVLAVHLANSPSFIGLIHALARLGGVLAPLNTRLTSSELTWQLEHLGARWLVSNSPGLTNLAAECSICQVITLEELWSLPTQEFNIVSLNFERVQAIVFTSGTSGRPKGAQVTFGAHFWSAVGSTIRLGMQPEDRWLSVLPLYHVGGLAVVFRSCLNGTAICLHQGFHLDAVAHSLREEPITLISLVPTMLRRLLAAGVSFPNTLRLVLLGGAAASADLLAACAQINLPIAVSYGLTEAASQVATLPPTAVYNKPGCVGQPLLLNQVKIVDSTSVALPPGEIGEICVSGPVVMPGYWQDEAASQRALRGGWLHTGDLGYLDADGDLWVVERRTDLILSGGENVYPAEVEAVLCQYPAVVEACVVGLPNEEWGQRVAAAVVRTATQPVSESELLEFARQRLAGYKLPRLLRFVDALPLTASGKVARQDVIVWLMDEIDSQGPANAS